MHQSCAGTYAHAARRTGFSTQVNCETGLGQRWSSLKPPAVTGVVTPDIRSQYLKYYCEILLHVAHGAGRGEESRWLVAVVGRGTSSFAAQSSASSISFCIMLTLNQASSGILSTNGPRYCTMGDAMALWVRTSTAVSRCDATLLGE
jgi:hypothetical protein